MKIPNYVIWGWLTDCLTSQGNDAKFQALLGISGMPMAQVSDIGGDPLVVPGAWSIGVVYDADKPPHPANPPVHSVWIGSIPGTADVPPELRNVDRGYGPGVDVLYHGEIKFQPGNYPQYPFEVVYFFTQPVDGACTNGSRKQTDAPDVFWLSYRDVFAEAVGPGSPLTQLAWLIQWPAAVVTDTAGFCSTTVPTRPAPFEAGDFVGLVPPFIAKMRQFAEYTLWKRYCECIPPSGSAPGALGGIEGTGNIPSLPAIVPPTPPTALAPMLTPDDKNTLLSAIQQCYCGPAIAAGTAATAVAVAAGTAVLSGELATATAALTAEVVAGSTAATAAFLEIQGRFTAVDTAVSGVSGSVASLRTAIPDLVKQQLQRQQLLFCAFRVVVAGDLSQSRFLHAVAHGAPRYRLGWCALRPKPPGHEVGRGSEYYISSTETILLGDAPGVDYDLDYSPEPGFTFTIEKFTISIPLYQESS